MSELWRRLSVLLRRRRFDGDLEEELRFHLEAQAEENRQNGMDAEEASFAARRQFGNLTLARETSREIWSWGWLERLGQDLRIACRMFRKNPGFTSVALLTMTLGIGANTAVFSVVNGVLVRPLPFKDPDRLVMVWSKSRKFGDDRSTVSPADLADWSVQNRSLDGLAAFLGWSAYLTIADERVEIIGASVAGNFFRVLGAEPVLGRAPLPEEEQGGDGRVVVLGHGLWQRLGRDPDVIGKTVALDRTPYTVTGVMAQGFSFPNDAQFWIPLPRTEVNPQVRGTRNLRVVGRLKAGPGAGEAQREMDTIAARLEQAYPQTNAGVGVNIVPLYKQIVGDVERALLVLLGAAGCVLLIACANVANLLLARAAGRRKEIAMRVALGAGRWRIIRYLLTESVLLAAAGGSLGLAGAYWSVQTFVALDPIKLPRLQEIAIDRGVLAFTFLISLLTGVLFGLAPALRASRVDLNEAFKEGSGRSALAVLPHSRGRSALAVAQVALAIMLMISAGLLLRSFVQRVSVPLGFRPENALGIELSWTAHRQIDQLLERIRALPGVEAAGAGTAFPFEEPGTRATFEIEARAKQPGEESVAGKLVVTADYFRAAGIPIRMGRPLTAADVASAPQVLVINEALARRYFPGENPAGRRLRWGSDPPWRTIVGVAADVKGFGVAGDPIPAIYMTREQHAWGNAVHVIVRTAVAPASLAPAVRREIRLWNNRLTIRRLGAVEDMLSVSVTVPRFYLALVGVFAALAAVLAAIGVYGVISCSVARRTHEIGVRVALGAESGDVLHMVIGHGLVLTLAGVGLGLAGAWVSTRVLESLLFGVRPHDLAAYTGASILLVAAGLVACYIPARRATKIDPMEALRYE